MNLQFLQIFECWISLKGKKKSEREKWNKVYLQYINIDKKLRDAKPTVILLRAIAQEASSWFP